MRWADDGIFLSGRPHGETSVIANIFTRANGRTHGLVKGGRSRRLRPMLQTGNGVRVEWRARLEDQLGVYTVELTEPTAARILDDMIALAGVNAIVSLLQVLPERDPHPKLFDAAEPAAWHWQTRRLPRLDHPLRAEIAGRAWLRPRSFQMRRDGRTDDLVYVSPRSGQAVSRGCGRTVPEQTFAIAGLPIGGRCVRACRLAGRWRGVLP